MKIKKFIASVLATVSAFAAFSFTSCGLSDSNKLIVYTEAGFAPWEFTQKGSTKIVGVDMEIAQYIAEKYDWELQVINGSFDAICAGIQEDNALGIAGISYNTSRAEAVDFSDFYWQEAYQTVVYKKDSNPTLIENAFAVSNFEGAKLVYQTGTTSQLTVDENKNEWKVVSTADFGQVIAALEDMKSATTKEYLIVDSQVAAQLVADDNTLAYVQIEDMGPESYGIVAKKGNTEMIKKVNAALAELLKDDETGKNQIEKWFEQYSAISSDEE